MVLGTLQLYQKLPHSSPGPQNVDTSFLAIPQNRNRKSSSKALVQWHEHTPRLIFRSTHLGLWASAWAVGPQYAKAQPGGPGRLSGSQNIPCSQWGFLSLAPFSGKKTELLFPAECAVISTTARVLRERPHMETVSLQSFFFQDQLPNPLYKFLPREGVQFSPNQQ